MTANVKFSQLPNLTTITANTIIPVVSGNVNYTVTSANLQTYVNGGSGNITSGNISATGNVTGGNILTAGLVSAGGNVTGNYILGNVAFATGIPATYGNANVAAYLPTYSGNIANLTITGTTTLNPYIETTAASVNSGSSFTPTMSNGPVQKVTATASFTLAAPSGMVQGQSITLIITQDATGNRVMTPNAAYKFAYGVKTLSTTASAIDMMSIFYDGTNYLCNLVKGYA
jgi:hypothetical protein